MMMMMITYYESQWLSLLTIFKHETKGFWKILLIFNNGCDGILLLYNYLIIINPSISEWWKFHGKKIINNFLELNCNAEKCKSILSKFKKNSIFNDRMSEWIDFCFVFLFLRFISIDVITLSTLVISLK